MQHAVTLTHSERWFPCQAIPKELIRKPDEVGNWVEQGDDRVLARPCH